MGLARHVTEDGFMHPFFNLHTTLTYRSSSEMPNFQNIPIRNKEIAKYVRSLFIARPGQQIVEIDYSGNEIKSAACYHKDPRMLEYIHNPETDMHRDMAGQIFFMEPQDVPKPVRQAAKGDFVFSQFFGDWYVANTKALWNDVAKYDLKTKDGLDLYSHLERNGIYTRGPCTGRDNEPGPETFEHHMKNVERDFWKKRFRVYDNWRRKWYEDYLNTGGFQTLTGFYISGRYDRNHVINNPIQGTAFHWLLWCLVRLGKQLKKRKMKSLIVGQIHDSIVLDVAPSELEDVLAMAKQIMCLDLPAYWPWIIVPMEIEADIAPVGGSWFDKQSRKL